MGRIRLRSEAVILVSMLVTTGAVIVADPDPPRPDIVAYAYADGHMLLMHGGLNPENIPDVKLFDLSSAAPDKRDRVMQEFLDGKYDGVLLGVPDELASEERDCKMLVDCAELSKRVCESGGGKTDFVSVVRGCRGRCQNGIGFSVTCH